MNRALRLLVRRQELCDKSIRLRLRVLTREFELISKGDKYDPEISRRLICSGNIELCKRVLKKAVSGCSTGLCMENNEFILGRVCKLELIEFIDENIQNVKTVRTLEGALEGGNTPVISWLMRNADYPHGIVANYSYRAPIHVVKWLHMIGIHLTSSHAYHALSELRIDDFEWIMEKVGKDNLGLSSLWYVAINGDTVDRTTKRVEYVEKLFGARFENHILMTAFGQNDVNYDVVEFLVTRGCVVADYNYERLPEYIQKKCHRRVARSE